MGVSKALTGMGHPYNQLEGSFPHAGKCILIPGGKLDNAERVVRVERCCYPQRQVDGTVCLRLFFRGHKHIVKVSRLEVIARCAEGQILNLAQWGSGGKDGTEKCTPGSNRKGK